MEKISTFIISRFSLTKTLVAGFIFIFILSGSSLVLAAGTSNFQQTIIAGTIAVDITDSSYVTVGSPSLALSNRAFSFSCQTSTGTFGTTSQQIYIVNPDAADNGFTVSLAGSATTAVWDSAGPDFDFNDPATSGCTDGVDTDTVGGQLTVNAAAGTVTQGACLACNTTGVTLGSSAAFNEGVINSVTLVTAASGSNDVGDWYVRGIGLSQTIPAEQAAAADYDINMTLSIIPS